MELKAAIQEGAAHADLSLQLCQLVLHGLREQRRYGRKTRARQNQITEIFLQHLQVSDRLAKSFPLQHVVSGFLKHELAARYGHVCDHEALLQQKNNTALSWK